MSSSTMKAIGAFLLLCSLAYGQQPPLLPDPVAAIDKQTPTFKVDVKLVNVFVTVTDANGAPVGGLKKEDFKLLEDGHPEQIAVFTRESELPLSIVLAVDTSLSTRRQLKLELESARRFAKAI